MSDVRTRSRSIEEERAGADLSQQRLRHDLRQSLSTVMLLAGIVDRHPLDGRVVHGTLDHMRHEVEWMTQVVAGLDDDPGDLLVDVGEAVAAIWGSVARARPCTMRFLREADAWTWADPVSLGRAVRNLVENAVRAAGEGVVEVRVGREAHRIAIEVHDSGPGLGMIKPQQQLGLVTVRRFAARYDGRLVFGTSPLGGALARLELPRVSPVADEPEDVVDVDAGSGARRRTSA